MLHVHLLPFVFLGRPPRRLGFFLTASRAREFERASEYLDLRGLPSDERDRGPELARHLRVVLDRTFWVDVGNLSDTNEGTANEECWNRLEVTVEAAANSLPGQPPQKISLRDFTATWTVVDERDATVADSVVQLEFDFVDAWRYIDLTTDQMIMRLEWFDPGNVFSPAWGARIDQAVWTLKP